MGNDVDDEAAELEADWLFGIVPKMRHDALRSKDSPNNMIGSFHCQFQFGHSNPTTFVVAENMIHGLLWTVAYSSATLAPTGIVVRNLPMNSNLRPFSIDNNFPIPHPHPSQPNRRPTILAHFVQSIPSPIVWRPFAVPNSTILFALSLIPRVDASIRPFAIFGITNQRIVDGLLVYRAEIGWPIAGIQCEMRALGPIAGMT